jgi:agmatinase
VAARPLLIGIPYDASSSYVRGAADGPRAMRDALASPAGNPYAEGLARVVAGETFDDAGDLAFPPGGDARGIIEDAVATLARGGCPFVALGGDHSITYPILRGLASVSPERFARGRTLTILQIDAHPDLYDEFEGDRYSHACPFARIMEERLCTRLVQIGIRAMTAHGRDQARRFGVEQIDMRAWTAGARPAIAGPWYLSLDLDGLDPAFAPGVAHREPGGLTVRELLALIESQPGPLVAADVVELNPAQDHGGVTAAVAAKLVQEILGRWLAP